MQAYILWSFKINLILFLLTLHTLHIFIHKTFCQTLRFCILNLKSAVSKYTLCMKTGITHFIFEQCLRYFSPEVMTDQNVLVHIKVNIKSELTLLFSHSRSCVTVGKKRQTQPPLHADFKLGLQVFLNPVTQVLVNAGDCCCCLGQCSHLVK